jgi:hypothetical protein
MSRSLKNKNWHAGERRLADDPTEKTKIEIEHNLGVNKT